MRSGEPVAFARGIFGAAGLGALALLPWLLADDRATVVWAGRGFVAMAAPGIVSGVWLAREHGRKGSRFVIALGAAFIARLVLAGTATLLAARAGSAAVHGLLPGLVAGFAPVMVYEMISFARAAASTASSGTRG